MYKTSFDTSMLRFQISSLICASANRNSIRLLNVQRFFHPEMFKCSFEIDTSLLRLRIPSLIRASAKRKSIRLLNVQRFFHSEIFKCSFEIDRNLAVILCALEITKTDCNGAIAIYKCYASTYICNQGLSFYVFIDSSFYKKVHHPFFRNHYLHNQTDCDSLGNHLPESETEYLRVS